MPIGACSATDRSNDLASVDVTELCRDDWALLKRLRLDALRDAPEAFVTTWNEEREQPRTYWRAQFDQRHWVMAYDYLGEPVGVAGLNFLDRDPARPWFVESVWVAPAHRCTGVLQQLVERLDKYALNKGVLTLQLWVLENNTRAEAAYTRLGYRRKAEYDQPTKKARPDGTFVTECLMVRPLP